MRVRWLLLLSLLGLPSLLQAESVVDQLPPPRNGDVAGVLINGATVDRYRTIIVPEIYDAIKSGSLEMDSARNVSYELPTFLPGAEEQSVLDTTEQVLASAPIQKFEFRLRTSRDDSSYREYSGAYTRVYSSEDATASSSILFRERVTFNSPPMIEDYSWLSYRLRDQEDLVWVYSTVVSKTRQVSGANRADSILSTAIAMEDLFTWSSDSSSVAVQVEGEVLALVPFAGVSQSDGEIDSTGTCLLVDETTRERYTGQVRQLFFQDSLYLPRKVVFVPRRLIKLSMKPKDPYSLYGRQVLYIDKVSRLPIYKFVFDRTGARWKSVFSVHGLVASKKTGRKYSYNSMLYVRDNKEKQTSLISNLNLTLCSGRPAESLMASFNPRSLAPVDESEVAE